MVQSLALYVSQPMTAIRQRQQSQPYLVHTSPSRCRLASGASPWQGRQLASGHCALAAAEPVASPVLSPPQHAHQPALPGRSCLFLPRLAPGHHAPTSGPPVQSSYSFRQSADQPLQLALDFCTTQYSFTSVPGPALLFPSLHSSLQAQQL